VLRGQLLQAMENEYRTQADLNNDTPPTSGKLFIQPVDIEAIRQRVEERVDDIFHSVDSNNDGKISKAEFIWAMTGSGDLLPNREKPQRHKSISVTTTSGKLVDPHLMQQIQGGANNPKTAMAPMKKAVSSADFNSSSSLSGKSKKGPAPPAISEPVSPANFRGIIARNMAPSMHLETVSCFCCFLNSFPVILFFPFLFSYEQTVLECN
jgi:hypothetical protein